MVGSNLSNMQRSKGQEGRYGKGEFSGGYELSRDKTSYYSPRYRLGDMFSAREP